MDEVKVEKIDTAEDPEVETADWDEHTPGEYNPKSPPVEYTIEGKLMGPGIAVGGMLTVRRWKRNGEEVDGVFRSSQIQSAIETEDGVLVETHNSIYKVTSL